MEVDVEVDEIIRIDEAVGKINEDVDGVIKVVETIKIIEATENIEIIKVIEVIEAVNKGC